MKLQTIYDIFDKSSPNLQKLNVYCIDFLKNYLDETNFVKPDFPKEYNTELKVSLFVTWLDESSKNYNRRLRGCIGTFRRENFKELLEYFTIISARKDTRFKSVEIDELKNFSTSVSILDELEECKDVYDWELGIHGVSVSFFHKNKEYSACYLPEVPIINNWDKKLTLDRCVKKSGYANELGHLEEVIGTMKVLKFKSIKSSITYNEYLKCKKS